MEQPLTGLMTPMVWLYLAFGCVALLALVAALVLVVMALRRRPDPALDGLVSQADIVRGQVEAGQLQPSQAQPLVAQDRRGQHWGLDPLEGGWQTWDGTEWQPAQPPRKRRRWPLLVTALVLGLVALCVLPAMGLWMLSEGTVEVPTLMPVCTPPACGPDEVYYCAGECPGGCGTTCATPTPAGGSTGPVTAMPRCTPPPCGPDEVYYCAEPCPGGCGTTCVTPTPSPAPSEAGEATPMVMCTPPLCGAGEVYHCPGECPGGCGTTCETPTPTAEPEKPPTVTPGSEAAARPTLTPVGGSGTPVPPATGCETEAWGWFEGALQMVAGVREGLGCPTEDAVDLAAASQDFQHG